MTIRHDRTRAFFVLSALALLLTYWTVSAQEKQPAHESQQEQAQEHEQLLDELAQPSMRMIAMIAGRFGDQDTFGAGIIFGRGEDRLYIVTANHVVRRGGDKAEDLVVHIRDIPMLPLTAMVLDTADAKRDLAVLRVEGLSRHGIDVCSLPFARLSDTEAVRRGDEVYAVGNPNGVPWSMPVLPDRIAQVVGDHLTFQSQFIRKGHSGGALLDRLGLLIGLIQKDEQPFGWAMRMPPVIAAVRAWGHPVHLSPLVEGGKTPLHMAVQEGSLSQIQKLLADPCNTVNVRDAAGKTPLHDAAGAGHVKAVQTLLEAGADVSARDAKQRTALHGASYAGQPEIIRMLLEAGSEVNELTAENQTPLMYAAFFGHLAAARTLVEAGADVDAAEAMGRAPIDLAADHGKRDVVNYLLDAGARLDLQRSGIVLHVAAREGWADVTERVLAAGIPADIKDKDGATSLHLAVTGGHLANRAIAVAVGRRRQRHGRRYR